MNLEILKQKMNNKETFIPLHMRKGYLRYIEHGIDAGDFSMAIIEQDAEKARSMADCINSNHIESQIAWVKLYEEQKK